MASAAELDLTSRSCHRASQGKRKVNGHKITITKAVVGLTIFLSHALSIDQFSPKRNPLLSHLNPLRLDDVSSVRLSTSKST